MSHLTTCLKFIPISKLLAELGRLGCLLAVFSPFELTAWMLQQLSGIQVSIEVSKHYMTHIMRGKPKLLNLFDRRVFLIKLDTIELNEERAKPRVRRLDIAQSKASIDENKSLVRLNKQTVAD